MSTSPKGFSTGASLVEVETVRESQTMRVTFDTNVWNRMVFPERHPNSPNYASLVKIKDAIRSGQVHGFISEGFGTVEAIQKKIGQNFMLRIRHGESCVAEIRVRC